MRRVAIWATALILFLTAIGAVGAWLITRTATAVWLVTRLAAHADTQLTIENATGSLLSGIKADRIEVRHANGRIVARMFAIHWDSLTALVLDRRLVVTELSIGHLDIEQASSTGQPSAPPASLALPIAVRLDRIAIGSMTFKQGVVRTSLQSLLARASIDVAAIEAWIDTIDTPVGSIVARARIGVEPPFAIEGAINANNDKADLPFRAEATLGGELALIGVGGTATVEYGSARAALVLTPFSETFLERIDATSERINPAKIRTGWPHAVLDVRLIGGMRDATHFQGDIQITNRESGTVDKQRVPIERLAAGVEWTGTEILVRSLRAALGPAGHLRGEGRYAEATAHIDLATDDLNLAGLHAKLHATKLRGTVGGSLAPSVQQLRGTLADTRLAADFDIEHTANRINVRALAIKAGRSRIDAVGGLELTGLLAFTAKGHIVNLDPSVFGRFESATLNAEFEANGRAGGEPSGNGRFLIRNSQARGFPIEGVASIDVGDKRIRAIDIDLSIAGNTVQAKGALQSDQDRLMWRIDAQHLGRLGLGVAGTMQASGVAQGTLATLESTFTGTGGALVIPGGVRIGTLAAEGRGSRASIELHATAQALSIGDELFDHADVTAKGTLDNHVLQVRATGQGMRVRATATGGMLNGAMWRGTVSDAVMESPLEANLRGPASLEVSTNRIALRRADLQAATGNVRIDSLLIEGETISSQGRFAGVQVSRLLRGHFASGTDLSLAGEWDIVSDKTLNGTVAVRREQGDVALEVAGSTVGLGLSLATLDLRAERSTVTATVSVQGKRLGEISGRVASRVARQGIGWTLPAASPIDGDVRLDAQTIAWLNTFAGGAFEVDGRVTASVRLSGTVGNPRPIGSLSVAQMRLAFPTQNIALAKGTVAATFDATRLTIDRSIFYGDAGSIRASGWIGLGAPLAGEVALDFDGLEAISDPTQTLKLSGQLRARFTASTITLTGALRTTEGRIRLADASVPKLGEDVVVKRRIAPSDAARRTSTAGRTLTLVTDVAIDLGQRFTFEGRGVKATLSGRLRVQTAPAAGLRVAGTVRVEEGTVMVYGKILDIEKGSITFTGSIDNPQLNLTATRRGIPHRVGVQVTGFALEPRATLFSDPSMPNSERLSWLVMGRSSEGLAATDLTLLSTAASAVLTSPDEVPLQSKVANVLGLDELAMRTTGAMESSVVAIGKRVSDKLYVTVERNLVGLGTALAVRYQFNKNWSLQGQTGLNNTVDLLYSVTFD
jgi:translocation and assembly module TamB